MNLFPDEQFPCLALYNSIVVLLCFAYSLLLASPRLFFIRMVNFDGFSSVDDYIYLFTIVQRDYKRLEGGIKLN